MNADSRELADKVVDSFEDLLDSDTRAAIGDSNLNALRNMIIEVIAERSKTIIERLEQDLKQLESDLVVDADIDGSRMAWRII